MKLIAFSFIFLFSLSTLAQDKKTINATRINNAPKIDGVLDDTVWSEVPKYGDFHMLEPGIEGEISEGFETEIQFAYDGKAVYIAGYMYDPDPSLIDSELRQRDDLGGQADLFTLGLNTYNDGINETRFGITSAGTIVDTKISQSNEDLGYNVVWEGRTSQDEKGWYAEFKIPYNALRFPEVTIQDWSLNFYRKIIRINETHSFSPINNQVGQQTLYNATILGVQNIDPPVRLTLFPFAQAVVGSFDGETSTNFSAGMDVKYGLSDSFTLDATLIPDFGQAAFDNVTLNLGPFEQTFSEQRQFFTEGIELFNKGRVFFSRRVGGAPSGSIDDLAENEEVRNFPDRVNLLNAVKISGRTKDQLGVGFFNAITEKTYATIENTDTGALRDVLVEPLTNYNVFVLDQQFNNNSSISLINTNVTRDGSFRDANTTGLVFDVSDKENTFNTSGRAIMSNVHRADGFQQGVRTELDLASTQGKFRWRVGHDFANKTFDINDLGVNFRNNFNNFSARINYRIFEPTNTFNSYRLGLSYRHNRLYDPNVSTGDSYDFDHFFVLKSRFAFGGGLFYRAERDDYFEPRVAGKFVTFESRQGGRAFISSDYRKKFAIDMNVNHDWSAEGPQINYSFRASPRYRFSDKLLVVYTIDTSLRNNQFGYIDNTDADVFFGQRDIKSIENSISASYNFDPFKAVSLRFRNFWTTVNYDDAVFFSLNDDGTRNVTEYDISEDDPNTNFNIWNLDLSYRWRFAPGSEASLLYRNQIFNFDELSDIGYSESLGNLFAQPVQHTVSLRITYFIDYNNVKYLFKKSS
jgi:hypothetical protein